MADIGMRRLQQLQRQQLADMQELQQQQQLQMLDMQRQHVREQEQLLQQQQLLAGAQRALVTALVSPEELSMVPSTPSPAWVFDAFTPTSPYSEVGVNAANTHGGDSVDGTIDYSPGGANTNATPDEPDE